MPTRLAARIAAILSLFTLGIVAAGCFEQQAAGTVSKEVTIGTGSTAQIVTVSTNGGSAGTGGGGSSGSGTSQGKPTTLKLESPKSGDLKFKPSALSTTAGQVTLDYTNPSAVPHNIALQGQQGDTVTGSKQSKVTVDLQPGTYQYYCAVPGHKEAGMVGTLTVKAAAAGGSGGKASGSATKTTSTGTSGGAGAAAGSTTKQHKSKHAGKGGKAGSGGSASTTIKLSSPKSGDLKFDQSTVKAKAGKVTLEYTNPSPVPHAIAVGDQKGPDIQGGKKESITVTLKPGTYKFYCPVPGHEQAGMVGKLIVS